jgi:hypothetical protein
MPGSSCSVDSDCPTGEVCVNDVCVSREGWQRCHGYDLQEYQNGQWVTIEPNSPTCGYTEPAKDAYYYDLYYRGWLAAAEEYLSSITPGMSPDEKYQIYLQIYYKYAGGGAAPPVNPPQEAFPWTWLAVGGAVVVGIILIVSTRRKR